MSAPVRPDGSRFPEPRPVPPSDVAPGHALVPDPRRPDAGPPARPADPVHAGATALPRGEIGSLTGLRFVAAVWVLVHHASFLPGETLSRWFAPVAPLVAAGPLGVDVFFVLSGLVLARTHLEREGGRWRPGAVVGFVWARVCRIWPLYAVVVTLFGLWCLARSRVGGDGVWTWQYAQPDLGPAGWLSQLTMTQLWGSGTFDGVSFVLPTWSVSAEWAAYLVFAVVGAGVWWLRRLPVGVLGALAVLAGSVPAATAVLGHTGGDGAVFPWGLRLAGGFGAGVLTWLALRRVAVTPTTVRRARGVVALALAEIGLVVLWAAAPPATAALAAPQRLLFAVPFLPLLLGALTLADTGPARWLATDRMRAGGRLSYALYLVHFPMVEVTWVAMTRVDALAPGSTGATLLVPHVLAASFAVAWAAHRGIEVPAQRALHRAGARVAARVRRVRAPGGTAGAAGGAAPT